MGQLITCPRRKCERDKMPEPEEYRALELQDIMNKAGEIPNWGSIVYIDIGSTNNYKVVKTLQVRNGHLIIVTGEKDHVR